MVNYHGIWLNKTYMHQGCHDIIIEYDWSWDPIEGYQNKGRQSLHIPIELWEEFKQLMKKELEGEEE